MQKTTKIDLRTDQIAYPSVGYQGEINKRTLQIIPPNDLKGADYFVPAFDLPDGVFPPPLRLTPPILVKLSPPVTDQREVSMTLEAYLADRTILGKSHMVILYFDKAVTGEAWELATAEDLRIEAAKNKPTRVEFSVSCWQGDEPNLHILIPADQHKKGIYARVTTACAELPGGSYAAALPCWERQINGDILLKSDTLVPGEIFIVRGD